MKADALRVDFLVEVRFCPDVIATDSFCIRVVRAPGFWLSSDISVNITASSSSDISWMGRSIRSTAGSSINERRVGSKSYADVRRQLGLVSESETAEVAEESVGGGNWSIV